MLNSETKRKIDTARQILVGKIPDPKAQVEQITTALVYKFMDDMDKEAQELGGEARFFTDGFSQYSWTKLMDNRLSGQEKLDLYVEAITNMQKNPHIPQLFRDIFKGAFLPFRDPRTLTMFLKEINEFEYDHSENLGNAFEYLLSVLGSQGDAGQFRTPRHIIDFIVEVVAPKKNDTILDPACGTAGFLISAYKHILKTNSSDYKPEAEKEEDKIKLGETATETVIEEKKSYNGDLLTPDDRKKLTQNITGYDISPDMVKLALVNLYLHGFTDPKIHEYDTLSSDKRWDEMYDIILANPPFMTPKGGISPHKRFSIQAKRSEVLFVDYIAEHLTIKGKAGIIVPEGIIFQSANAYKNLRKNLIENWGLYAVVSLPGGVFQPYSGVKTSILLMDREFAKRTDEILFVKVENDGFDLGAQRRKIEKNDLPDALKALESWKCSLVIPSEAERSLAFAVNKEKIAENGEYNLTGDRYRQTVDYSNAKWPMVELGKILGYEQPTNYLVQSTNYKDTYQTPVLTAGKSFLLGYTNEENGIFPAENLPVIIFDDFTTSTKFVDFPFKVKSSAMKILKAKKNVDIRYVFYMMQKINFDASQHKRYWISQYSKIQIPLPPLEVQKQIVSEIEQYQKVIDGAKQVVENWEPSFRIDPDWPMVELGEVFCRLSNNIDPQKKQGNVNYVGLENIEPNTGRLIGNIETKYQNIKSAKTYFEPDQVLYGKLRPNLNKVFYTNFYGICSTDIFVLQGNRNKVNHKFYSNYLRSKLFNDKVLQGLGGAQLPRVSWNYLSKIQVPLPSIQVQKQLVEEIEAEQQIVNSNKKLIEKMEQKIEAKISEVWDDEN